jgi:hypothetical protein
MLGRRARDRRHSLAQLTAIYRPPEAGAGIVQTQLYSYRSLLNFRLIKDAPLPHREAIRVFRELVPLLGILGINHEDRPSRSKSVVLRRAKAGGPSTLEINYVPSPEERAQQRRHQRKVVQAFARLHCVPIFRIEPGSGSSIHYAGTFGMSRAPAELTSDLEGRLRGTKDVYLADGSALPYLPAKGLTFTLMANARRIAVALAARLAA